MKSKYPAIAGLAAQVEMFGLSKREIEKKFTRSEMILLAWRSQELSAQLDRSTEEASKGNAPGRLRKQTNALYPEGLPDRFFNEEGELDMRLMTGDEAYKYMSSMGVRLPMMRGKNRAR